LQASKAAVEALLGASQGALNRAQGLNVFSLTVGFLHIFDVEGLLNCRMMPTFLRSAESLEG
jgi:hypothetical protein